MNESWMKSKASYSMSLSEGSKCLVAIGIIFILFLIYVVFHYMYIHRMQDIYLEVGSFLSILCCSFIVISYIRIPQYCRHPNSLLFWKSMTDLLFTVRLCCGYSSLQGNIPCGQIISAFTQFTALSSECWFFAMAIDLWLCATNPFTDIRFNLKMYHVFSWSIGGISALVALIFPTLYTEAPGGMCWFHEIQHRLYGWCFYYGWVSLFVIGSLIILVLENRAIPVGGMLETVQARKDIIRSGRITSMAYCSYQLCSIAFWVIAGFLPYGHSSFSKGLKNFLSLLHGSKGVIDLIAWISINYYQQKDFLLPFLHSSSILHNTKPSNPNLDIDLQPQLNVELRKEVLHFTAKGVIAAVSHCHTLKLPKPVVRLKIHELGISTPFKDYQPLIFLRIRMGFGLDNETYKRSFALTCHERIQSGRSGAFLYYTADYRFIVKSINERERSFLLKILPSYVAHMKENPDSYITRFYGCHSIYMYGQIFSFVVMGNVIGRQSMHEFYDIKGSWVDRNAQPIPLGKTMICAYCSRPFKTGSWDQCSESIRGRHMPHIVLKDNDFRKKLRLSPEEAQRFVGKIKVDADFLHQMGITDYSLLISIHNAKYRVDHTNILPAANRENSKRFQMLYRVHEDPKCTYSVENLKSDVFQDHEENIPLLSTDDLAVRFGTMSPSNSPTKGGLQARVVVGADYYTFGIIDILQTWTWRKRLERFVKVYIYQQDKHGISAVEPKEYTERFKNKVEDIALMHHLDDL